jgi:hypothetical protein
MIRWEVNIMNKVKFQNVVFILLLSFIIIIIIIITINLSTYKKYATLCHNRFFKKWNIIMISY